MWLDKRSQRKLRLQVSTDQQRSGLLASAKSEKQHSSATRPPDVHSDVYDAH
ncbi:MULTISPECIES: hypothetical protein [unclassified Nostoc]|uniref:hypothetical protein n=1 Tax=unclassified Nostoc TaxID=2593658 RepID=UPI002AD40BB1|nr:MULTISPECIES: hypothetical protein [unclassified Nostoc]MDZ8226715.1 hypothetical protein [Nostoc sp. ChiVER01]MDZ8239762.1 hypothetical protein [Nostoc sp. ChiQUE01a]